MPCRRSTAELPGELPGDSAPLLVDGVARAPSGSTTAADMRNRTIRLMELRAGRSSAASAASAASSATCQQTQSQSSPKRPHLSHHSNQESQFQVPTLIAFQTPLKAPFHSPGRTRSTPQQLHADSIPGSTSWCAPDGPLRAAGGPCRDCWTVDSSRTSEELDRRLKKQNKKRTFHSLFFIFLKKFNQIAFQDRRTAYVTRPNGSVDLK